MEDGGNLSWIWGLLTILVPLALAVGLGYGAYKTRGRMHPGTDDSHRTVPPHSYGYW